MKPRLIVLASYPKSGNTWLRLVLNNLLQNDGLPVSINDINIGNYGNRRWLFDHYGPWPSSDLNDNEIDCLWPDVYRQFNGDGERTEFLKCHANASRNTDSEWVFPPETIRAVLHLVRHPFDVAMSLANHFGTTLEQAVETMTASASTEKKSRRGLNIRLSDRWGNWRDHCTSWLDAAQTYFVVTMRYEDLLANPRASFCRLARAAGVNFTDDALTKALEHTRFESLQKQEAEKGFREHESQGRQFFRAGRSGTWQGHLSDAMRRQLIAQCGEVMSQFGYGEDGEIRSTFVENSVHFKGDIRNGFESRKRY